MDLPDRRPHTPSTMPQEREPKDNYGFAHGEHEDVLETPLNIDDFARESDEEDKISPKDGDKTIRRPSETRNQAVAPLQSFSVGNEPYSLVAGRRQEQNSRQACSTAWIGSRREDDISRHGGYAQARCPETCSPFNSSYPHAYVHLVDVQGSDTTKYDTINNEKTPGRGGRHI